MSKISLAALCLLAVVHSASAVTITVNSNADTPDATPGDGTCGSGAPPPSTTCTLRAAIQEANANASASNVIDLATNEAKATISVLTALPDITKPVNINGPAKPDRTIVDGASNTSLFRFQCSSSCPTGGIYSISNLIIRNGKTADTAGGGGVYFAELGQITFNMTNVDVVRSAATAGPGGGVAINVLANNSVITLDTLNIGTTPNGQSGDTTTGGNTASGNGGGLWVRDPTRGSTVTLTHSTVVANSSSAGSGGGINVKRGRLSVFQSTISGNSANGAGGGIFLETEAASGGNVRLENDTITANSATSGGGIGAASDNPTASSMTFTTVTANSVTTGSSGGGIQAQTTANTTFPGDSSNPFTSNVVANNNANSVLNNCKAAFSHSDPLNSGYNLTDDASCGLNQASDHVVNPGSDPNAALGIKPLANNPVAPQTFALLAGSPAIDAGNPTWDPGIDERGAASQDGGARGIPGSSTPVRDIGAYEFGGFGLIQFDFPAASNDFPVAEDSGPVVVLIKRYGTASGLSSAPTVVFTSSDSTPVSATQGPCSTVGNDYTALASNPTTNLVFATGITSQSTSIAICNDTLVEGNETFNIGLATPAPDTVGYDLGPRAKGTVTIKDVENGVFAFDNAAPHAAAEGNPGSNGSIMLTITRTSGTDGPVRVNYQTSSTGNCPTSACTATADSDYTSVTGFVDFADKESSKTITINFIGDTTFEADETFRVNLTDVSCLKPGTGTPPCDARLLAGTTAEPKPFAVVTINNDDAARPGTLQFDTLPEPYTGNKASGKLTVRVKRVGGADGTVSVDYAATDGTAKSAPDASDPDPDYALAVTSHTLTWNDADATDKTFDVTLNSDASPESNKTFTLSLDNATLTKNCPDPRVPSNCTTVGSPGSEAVTLISDKLPQFQFSSFSPSPCQTSYCIAEGSSVTVTVTTSGFKGPDVTVPYYTVDGSAISPADYTGVPVSNPNNVSPAFTGDGTSQTRTFSIQTAPDTLVEGNETFNVQLGTPKGGGVIAGANPATVTIIDPAAVRFTAASFASASEANGSVITVSAERIGDTTQQLMVDFTISQNCANPAPPGCAEESVDYTRAAGFSGTLTWAAGATANQSFAITVLGDILIEGPESIKVTLSNPRLGAGPTFTPGALGSPFTATAVITDDDYRFEIVDASPKSVSEGVVGGNAVISVRRFGSAIGAASVSFATADGTAKAGTDYTATASPPALSWAAGEGGVKTISVPVINNTRYEPNRSFTLALSSPSNNVSGEATSVVGSPLTVTIVDDDPPPTVSFSTAAQSVTEGTGAGTTTVTVTATLSAASGFDTTVPFTVSGTATGGGVDHNATAGSISIPAGSTSGTYSFTVARDALHEADETVVFTMGTPVNATAAVPSTHTVTIADDDPAPTVSFSTATQSVIEGTGAGTTTVTVTATLSVVSGVDTTVPFTVSGTATGGGVDHDAAAGSISIPAGSTSGTYSFTVTRDSDYEPDETVIFTMGTPTNATAAAPTTQTVTILDDDPAPPPSGGGGGSFDLMSLLLLIPAFIRRRRGLRA